MTIIRQLLFSLLLMPVCAFSMTAGATYFGISGAVFTSSNSAEGNQIFMFGRNAFGRLKLLGSYPTGGLGTGSGLGNQGAVVLSHNRQWLFTVNAGSDDISVFSVSRHGLKLVDVEPSGGDRPVSLAVDGDLLYVLNAGSDSISGFTLNEKGDLSPLADSTRSLSGVGTAPAQISFTPWGDALVVTEKATNLISVFLLDDEGLPGNAVLNASEGVTPFGFGFDRRGHLLVSEAAGGAPEASSVSSYRINRQGSLEVISGAVASTQTAACWLLVSKNGRVAFTTNTGSSTLSAYDIRRNGKISLKQEDGVAANTLAGSRPIDMAQSGNGRFVYALSAAGGSISAFYVNHRGQLKPITSVQGLVETINGLAAF
ncbi:hypothetical protein BTA51_20460 [Hahella sp. CCB-MM4]|uniref:lactonase family protein n=1 Tax=Hahella sp. (strain CCB-MM4) TaxID=1926491 RepID=UPI000BCE3307|nr:beta-propeller fold lactonase family protein [Hahella sp. CCB-MM4]OZG71650.1 hypothetical protein BTA51_20460 [Hahella sp. CCB-MM4]